MDLSSESSKTYRTPSRTHSLLSLRKFRFVLPRTRQQGSLTSGASRHPSRSRSRTKSRVSCEIVRRAGYLCVAGTARSWTSIAFCCPLAASARTKVRNSACCPSTFILRRSAGDWDHGKKGTPPRSSRASAFDPKTGRCGSRGSRLRRPLRSSRDAARRARDEAGARRTTRRAARWPQRSGRSEDRRRDITGEPTLRPLARAQPL